MLDKKSTTEGTARRVPSVVNAFYSTRRVRRLDPVRRRSRAKHLVILAPRGTSVTGPSLIPGGTSATAATVATATTTHVAATAAAAAAAAPAPPPPP